MAVTKIDPAARRPLGKTGVTVSMLGAGGGSLFCRTGDEGGKKILDACWDEGLRFFDTAPYYGKGVSEARFGSSLRPRPRKEYVVSTKVGHIPDRDGPPREGAGLYNPKNYDYSAQSVRQTFNESLGRIGVDYVDVVMIHDLVEEFLSYDFEKHFDIAMSQAYPELQKLKKEGKIGAVGVAVKDWKVCLRLAKAAKFDCFLLAADYNFLRHDSLDEFLPHCLENDTPVIIGAPFCMGILATGAIEGARYFFGPPSPEIIAKTQRVERVCKRHNVPLPAASLQFPLFHPAIASVLVGLQSVEELKENCGHMRREIPKAFWDDLKEDKVLPAHAPTP